MRGQQLLFSELFTKPEVVVCNRRPRNFYLPERNEALLHRYYFHAEINRFRYDDCIAYLESEFYLTAPRIVVLLSTNVSRLEQITNERPSINCLAKRYPHFRWVKR